MLCPMSLLLLEWCEYAELNSINQYCDNTDHSEVSILAILTNHRLVL